jgi:pimeloyl-ACP methyl ester carboxylesterase
MPLNLAFTGINKADDIMEQFPEIESRTIGGPSLGGAMAADYAKNNVEALDGLIMYAYYPANNWDFIDFPIPILCIVGSADPGAPNQRTFRDTVGEETAELVIIEGANHRQYADYAVQNNDGVAIISAAEQQAQIITAAVEFLDTLD